jgi:cell division protein FtsI/penicillin-binding protein 2
MKHRAFLATLLLATALLPAGGSVPRADEPGPLSPAAIPAATVVPSGLESLAVGPAPAGEAGSEVGAAVATATSGAMPIALGDVHLDRALGRFVAPFGDARAILTLDVGLQARLERSLATYRVPWGATVLLEARTGRVVALAEHSEAEPGRKGIALSAIAPAASIFKIVTAAALLERGVGAGDEVCYHGGRRRLAPKLLADDPRRDRRCLSLAEAFGHSTNVVFAKLAGRDLDAAGLRAAAERFLFNVPIPFARSLEPSRANVPDDPFGLANTAAGFGDVRLSPLHAALLGSVVANGGILVPPVLVDDVEGGALPAPPAPWRVVDEAVAAELAGMMRNTVTAGTARRVFRRTAAGLRGVNVAGKTGSLSDPRPFKDYTWFVGYAPAEDPEIVVATVIVNGRLWHARAPTVAKEALEAFFGTRAVAMRTASAR